MCLRFALLVILVVERQVVFRACVEPVSDCKLLANISSGPMFIQMQQFHVHKEAGGNKNRHAKTLLVGVRVHALALSSSR